MVKTVKKIWDEFIYGGHFLAFGDALTLYAFGMILGIRVTWDFFLIIYLCVFSANLFNREEEHDTDKLTNPIRVKIMEKYVKNQKYIIPLSLFVVVFLFINFAELKTLALNDENNCQFQEHGCGVILCFDGSSFGLLLQGSR